MQTVVQSTPNVWPVSRRAGRVVDQCVRPAPRTTHTAVDHQCQMTSTYYYWCHRRSTVPLTASHTILTRTQISNQIVLFRQQALNKVHNLWTRVWREDTEGQTEVGNEPVAQKTRKPSSRKDDRAMRRTYYIWMPWKISELPGYAHGYFSRNCKWAFVVMDRMKVHTKFEVRSFTRSWDIRGYFKNLDSPWIRPCYSHVLIHSSTPSTLRFVFVLDVPVFVKQHKLVQCLVWIKSIFFFTLYNS